MDTTDRAPLVPPDVDLRDFQFMPLDVLRLRDSDLAATPDAEAFRSAVLSWCVAWHQIPAASLPDDDAVLARLLGYGRDVETWRTVRANGGLRGWVRCSDGRLYHPVVAQKALAAWEAKSARRQRTEAARRARAERRTSCDMRTVTDTVTDDVTISVTDTVTSSKGYRERYREGEDRRGDRDREREGEGERGARIRARIAPPSASPRLARGTRLPADWHLPDDWADWAIEQRPDWTPSHVRHIADCFRDYWSAKAGRDACKLDWLATWRNWVRREADRQPSTNRRTIHDERSHTIAVLTGRATSGRVIDIPPATAGGMG